MGDLNVTIKTVFINWNFSSPLVVVICGGYNHRNSTSCLSAQFCCTEESFETSPNPDRRNNNGKELLVHFDPV